ncbi:MAG: glutamine--fructose-6-phosphate transaminase (isomerizing) [Synergistaceae bacterium]|nr:glutamine--fructose-6-phosphate transaminase (isomerizing) [Synergistaceae bacterium]PKL05126.1 MAG: glutamine--fructose-6-phosphate transaminase (isomerizing) [Synergistetes bacterium HGW-Synergistetes-1]MBP9559377.1 glutamine--fructose-6-phosphate transaminase (isomerizing) [Synergistaceae bacterium]MBP9974983.1 glutamine--fructose-6-phosphate transaminase (isomerizing) [Synergistaceae bacterium]MCE5183578.1 glutamine--fructose-6-phosphate transaminase (isomerizing) [Synergistaceae bacteri
MCGIMGYIGDRDTTKVILEGLAKHEYRGYDSAGIAVIKDGVIHELRTTGRVYQLAEKVAKEHFNGDFGIGHTRWATHGGVTENNAHPHMSSDNKVVLVHNGIIENAREIRADLEAEGIKFHTETDTESAVQYLASVYCGDPKEAIVKLTKRIRGAFALVIMFHDKPNEIWVARKGSPLVVGHAGEEGFCASDPTALLEFTRDVWFMDDDEIAMISKGGCTFYDFDGNPHEKESMHLDWEAAMTSRGNYPHFMLKEIHEQPEVVTHTLLGRVASNRVDLSHELDWTPEQISGWKKIHFVACGTSHYATMVAARIMEEVGNFEIRTEVASEYRYRNIPIGPDTLAVFVSQSGETADTLHAARLAKAKGAKCIVVTNVRGSTIHREVGEALITPAGPEIGVAATKTFMAQITVLTLLGLYLSKLKNELCPETEQRIVSALMDIPAKLASILEKEKEIEAVARNFADARGFFFIGRGLAYPPALEGALKLKEISYLHAEAYPAGEMKHGPIALLDKELPVVALVPKNDLWEKTISNIEESMARNSPIIALATEGDTEIEHYSKNVIFTPETEPELFPFIAVVPLQLFAYYIARQRGCDIDMPRNLAKSVTVE